MKTVTLFSCRWDTVGHKISKMSKGNPLRFGMQMGKGPHLKVGCQEPSSPLFAHQAVLSWQAGAAEGRSKITKGSEELLETLKFQ